MTDIELAESILTEIKARNESQRQTAVGMIITTINNEPQLTQEEKFNMSDYILSALCRRPPDEG